MSGRNQAMNLTGLLDGIAGAFNGMGDAYNFAPNAIRNIARPELDTSSADSVLKYANWAARNGYEDEAARYMALGTTLKSEEEKKSYADSQATDAQKIRVLRGKLATMESEIENMGDPSDPMFSAPGLIVARDNLQNQINNTIEGMNRRGEASRFGVSDAGNTALTSIKAAEHESMMATIDMQKAIRSLRKMDMEETDVVISAALMPHLYLDPARQRVYEERYRDHSNMLQTRMGAGTENYVSAMKQWNEIQKRNADNVNDQYFKTQEKLATKLADDAIRMLRSDLDRQNGTATSLGEAFVNWFDDVLTDQADAKTWLENPDNALLIQSAIERTALSAPYIVNGWDAMSTSEKLAEISTDVIANLQENPVFAEELAEDLVVRAEDEAELQAQVDIKNKDTGLDSPEYKNYLDLVEQKYQLEYGVPNIDEIRKNDPAAWAKIQADWKVIWDEMQGR